jgi:lipoprotein NlpI
VPWPSKGLGETDAAIIDFENALRAGGYPEGLIHRKLAWNYWNSARLADTARSVEYALADKPDADMFVLRGLTRYAIDDFSAATELDFSAASALQPNHGYATIFQHLCSCLAGRPERSRLFDSAPVRDSTPTVLTLDLGNLVVRHSGGAIPPWPATVIAFLKGEQTEGELLARAVGAGSPDAVTQLAEAHFYISQKARMAGDNDTERRHLEACISTPVPGLAEYQLACQRLNRLR